MLFDTVAIVGVGLLGGSVAKAVRAKLPVKQIIGLGRDAEKLARAQALGIIDTYQTSINSQLATADVVVICSPVDQIAGQVVQALTHLGAQGVVTDVGSTKAHIVRDVQAKCPHDGRFVAAHPMAGSEKTGFEHAKADLFVGRNCLLCPGSNTLPGAIEKISLFWQSLGCHLQRLTPEEHDLVMATTSHLPHFLASLMAGSLPHGWQQYTGTGFRDTTRLAAGDPGMWTAIAHDNALSLIHTIEKFKGSLDRLQEAIAAQDGEAIRTILTNGKRVRDALGS